LTRRSAGYSVGVDVSRGAAKRLEGGIHVASDALFLGEFIDRFVEPDELIEQLVPDPSNPPTVVGLDGYIGRSDREGHIRLYRDLSVSYWLDIPEDKIHFTKTADVEGKFHRMSVVWVERDALVRPQTTSTDDPVLLEFLNGEFTAGNLTEVELPEGYESDTGLWRNHLQGTIRHLRRPWTRCK
jgi:hypothetical protein